MVETVRSNLIDLLLANYEELKRRLARRIGSIDLAADALQDTFIQLKASRNIRPVEHPMAYIFRIAMRLAVKQQKRDGRHVSLYSNELFLDLVDDAPDPNRIVEARLNVELLKRRLAELPERRRNILLAALVDEVPQPVIAQRFNVTVRTVQNELKLGLADCAKHLLNGQVKPISRLRNS
jgi:RNA polymerase sigma-70 factor, ECF subfamily